MAELSRETQELLLRVARGEQPAFEDLFNRHRHRLRRMVAMRLDRRLAGRVDPSDILQETYLEAARRFDAYLKKPEMSFYLWLRWIARDKAIQEYRRHVQARKRAVDRELEMPPATASAELTCQLLARDPTPTGQLRQKELAECLRDSLARLGEEDRQVILWRHFEGLSVGETGELLGITKAAASKRYLRALQKLRRQLLARRITGAE